MMLETSLQLVGKIKKNHCFLVEGSQKIVFEYLIEDRISIAIAEIIEKLAIVAGSPKVALLSMIALGDVWFELFSEIMFFILFHVFFRYLMFVRKNW